MVLVPIKINKEKGKICQENFLHDFVCELTGEYNRTEQENIRGKVSISEVTNFDIWDGRRYQQYQSFTLRHSGGPILQRKRNECIAGIKISKYIQIHSDIKSDLVFPSRSNRNYLSLSAHSISITHSTE